MVRMITALTSLIFGLTNFHTTSYQKVFFWTCTGSHNLSLSWSFLFPPWVVNERYSLDQSEAASHTMRHELSLPPFPFPFAFDQWKNSVTDEEESSERLRDPVHVTLITCCVFVRKQRMSWIQVLKDTARYQRDVYRITQPLGAFFFISHTVLSLVESKGKWKWRKAQLVSHGMRGSFWLVQTIFFIDYSWREEKASRAWVNCTQAVDKRFCLCQNYSSSSSLSSWKFCLTNILLLFVYGWTQ